MDTPHHGRWFEDLPVGLALEELNFFTTEVRILGVYPASESREQWKVAD